MLTDAEKLKKIRYEYRLTQKELANSIDVTSSFIGLVETGKSKLSKKAKEKISELYNLEKIDTSNNCIPVTYRPDVYLSAGYGVEVLDERAETMMLDKCLFMTDRGTLINPKSCEIVRISGRSMEPEYRHGDRVIINLGDKELADGHIFAFRYMGETYVKELNLLGSKIKCISLNREYDAFYINKDEDFEVIGRILPRVRL